MSENKNQANVPQIPFGFTLGYTVSLYGVAIILLWIGVFKFTPTEAAAIQPLVSSHPLMSWMNRVFELQTVSNIIGIIEIFTAICIIILPLHSVFRKLAAVGILGTFLITLSFIFSKGSWKIVDGVLITDFFILKDLVCLGFGLMVLYLPIRRSYSSKVSGI